METETLRVLIAALAPAEQKVNFEPQWPDEPAAPEGAAWCENCKTNSAACDQSPACVAMHVHMETLTLWRLAQTRLEESAWRLAWADNLIEQAGVRPYPAHE